MTDVAVRASARTRNVLPYCKPLVRLFLQDPDRYGSGFAGPTFDELAPNDSERWTPADLVAVALLDVNVSPVGVRKLLVEESTSFNQLLQAIDCRLPLWSDDDEAVDAALAAAADLTRELERIPGVGTTTSSKLLARKRPVLIPINDSVIRRVLSLKRDEDLPAVLRAALRTDGLLELVRSLSPTEASNISELRLLDVALWMAGSRSRSAKRARIDNDVESLISKALAG